LRRASIHCKCDETANTDKINGRLDVYQAGHEHLLSSAGFERGSALADVATAPSEAAATAAATTSAAAAPATTAAAAPATAAATTTAATAPGELIAELGLSGLFVEDVESRQAYVRELFLAEDDFVIRRGLLRRQVRHMRAASGGRSGATRER
jgi:pyruvate/2-oxoglutarate dehydrogenase complex dihydrolipoamide acyltransferase (E2) component